ncbi:MAG: helix-turn-helix domain-containing protein [Clostridiales bacterium]|nr:MAG: helix-turn-helix domain-containing protein [Clostridiales bacterium]
MQKVLKAYLVCDGSVMAVAEKYGLHRNTVNSKNKGGKKMFSALSLRRKKRRNFFCRIR